MFCGVKRSCVSARGSGRAAGRGLRACAAARGGELFSLEYHELDGVAEIRAPTDSAEFTS
jgi:hypothetical protein